MLGLGLSLWDCAERRGGGGTPTPTPVTNIVIEGDSITSGSPSTPNGFYSYQYDDYRTDKAIEVRAQASRTVGALANLNDGSNTLIGHIAEDKAYGCQLITAMIGDNDLASNPDTDYRTSLINYKAQFGAVKFAWSPPLPYNPTGTPHVSYTTYTTNRAALLADCRNPTVWAQYADYYFPMGEYPDFADAALAAPLFGDTIHPNGAGHTLLYSVYKPAIDTIIDATKASSTTMDNAVWLASETNLSTSSTITRRFIVSGIAHAGLATGVSVTGAGSPQVRLNGGTYGSSVGTGSGNGYRIYNGDTIDLKLTTSASNNTAVSLDLTVGSETRTLSYTTVAAVTPAAYSHGGTAENTTSSATHTITGISFPADGVGLIAVNTLGNLPTGLTWNGVAATLVFSSPEYMSLAVYRVPVTTGVSASVVISFGSARELSFISYGTVTNADSTPTYANGSTAPNSDNPNFSTASATVPASGIAIGFFGQYDGGATHTAGTVNSPSTQFVSAFGTAFNGEQVGLIGGKRTTTGAIGFNFNYYSNWPVGIVVFKAAGT